MHIEKVDGGQPAVETSHYEYVIGTDGAKGVVRKALGFEFKGETRKDGRIAIVDAIISGMEYDNVSQLSLPDLLSLTIVRAGRLHLGRPVLFHVGQFFFY